jgi:hypothetical protein
MIPKGHSKPAAPVCPTASFNIHAKNSVIVHDDLKAPIKIKWGVAVFLGLRFFAFAAYPPGIFFVILPFFVFHD